MGIRRVERKFCGRIEKLNLVYVDINCASIALRKMCFERLKGMSDKSPGNDSLAFWQIGAAAQLCPRFGSWIPRELRRVQNVFYHG